MRKTQVIDTKSLILTRDLLGRDVCVPMPGYTFVNGADRFVIERENYEESGRIRQRVVGHWETDRVIRRDVIPRKTWEAALEIPKAYLKPAGL